MHDLQRGVHVSGQDSCPRIQRVRQPAEVLQELGLPPGTKRFYVSPTHDCGVSHAMPLEDDRC